MQGLGWRLVGISFLICVLVSVMGKYLFWSRPFLEHAVLSTLWWRESIIVVIWWGPGLWFWICSDVDHAHLLRYLFLLFILFLELVFQILEITVDAVALQVQPGLRTSSSNDAFGGQHLGDVADFMGFCDYVLLALACWVGLVWLLFGCHQLQIFVDIHRWLLLLPAPKSFRFRLFTVDSRALLQ